MGAVGVEVCMACSENSSISCCWKSVRKLGVRKVKQPAHSVSWGVADLAKILGQTDDRARLWREENILQGS